MLFFFCWGFTFWVLATIAFRFFGQLFLDPNNQLLIVIAFIVVVPLIALLTYPIYTWQKVSPWQRPLAAASIVFPGMLLDAFSVWFFDSVFPNLLPEADRYFSSGLLWAYAIVLLTGFVPNPKKDLSAQEAVANDS